MVDKKAMPLEPLTESISVCSTTLWAALQFLNFQYCHPHPGIIMASIDNKSNQSSFLWQCNTSIQEACLSVGDMVVGHASKFYIDHIQPDILKGSTNFPVTFRTEMFCLDDSLGNSTVSATVWIAFHNTPDTTGLYPAVHLVGDWKNAKRQPFDQDVFAMVHKIFALKLVAQDLQPRFGVTLDRDEILAISHLADTSIQSPLYITFEVVFNDLCKEGHDDAWQRYWKTVTSLPCRDQDKCQTFSQNATKTSKTKLDRRLVCPRPPCPIL